MANSYGNPIIINTAIGSAKTLDHDVWATAAIFVVAATTGTVSLTDAASGNVLIPMSNPTANSMVSVNFGSPVNLGTKVNGISSSAIPAGSVLYIYQR